jgi:hypothetical protein
MQVVFDLLETKQGVASTKSIILVEQWVIWYLQD